MNMCTHTQFWETDKSQNSFIVLNSLQFGFIFVLSLITIIDVYACTCLCVRYTAYMQVPMEARRGCHNTWNWTYRRLDCPVRMLGPKPGSSTGALTCWAIFQLLRIVTAVVIFWGAGWPQIQNFSALSSWLLALQICHNHFKPFSVFCLLWLS